VRTEEFAQQQVAGKQRLDDLFGGIADHKWATTGSVTTRVAV